jgi:hypothetical protein
MIRAYSRGFSGLQRGSPVVDSCGDVPDDGEKIGRRSFIRTLRNCCKQNDLTTVAGMKGVRIENEQRMVTSRRKATCSNERL